MSFTPLSAAIDTLTATLQESIDNSKIMKTLDEQISSALGLLVDLILLPFLPLLVGGIIQLYMAVIDFGKWWDNVTGVLKEEGLLGLIKLSLTAMYEGLSDWVGNLLKFLFGTDEEKDAAKKKAIDGILNFIDNVKLSFLPLAVALWILDILMGGKTVKMIESGIRMALEAVGSLVQSIIEFIFEGGTSLANTAVEFSIKVAKGVGDFLWGVLEWVYNLATKGAEHSIDFVVNLLPNLKTDVSGKDFWDQIGLGGVFSAGGDFGKMLGFADGGVVPGPKGKAQLAVVHGGETITPPGQSGGSLTFNFYGLTNEELPEKVRSILRQDGTRYMV